jgi:hypothetical protein
MKTAMEMLEEFICVNNYTEIDLINKIQELKLVEKENIKNAYYEGNCKGYDDHQLMKEENNEKYFSSMFGKSYL